MSWAYLWVFASASLVIVGDYFAKLWSTNLSTWAYVATLISYAVGSALYMPVLLKEDLVTTALVWSLLNIIGFTFVGLYIFGEHISITQTIGICFGIVAVILLVSH